MLKVLFAVSEAHPLIKTGGLGDVAGTLPLVLRRLDVDIRLVLPAYREVLSSAGRLELVNHKVDEISPAVRILQGQLANSNVVLWLVDAPQLFDRDGHPYLDSSGQEWPDNAQRFTAFCETVVAIARDRARLEWLPDIVHCNDWQTGLVPALLAQDPRRAATVFTIHNIAYQGLFTWQQFSMLGLPPTLWSIDSMEFYNQISFIKGGIMHSDVINTVSPRYAEEIRTKKFGCGMEGVLQQRQDRLYGILNGVDYDVWDPRNDKLIRRQYDYATFRFKHENKVALQQELGLDIDPTVPMLGIICRLVEQKGIDLVIELLPKLSKLNVQFVALGGGTSSYEQRLLAIAARNSRKFAVHIGYNERLAHMIEAGADMFLMPSRFEPCGLNQIYSLRYGTLPIVHETGGLADTVTDATEANLRAGSANGFVFSPANIDAFEHCVMRALAMFQQERIWKKLVRTAMAKDFSWNKSAQAYLDLYRQALDYRG